MSLNACSFSGRLVADPELRKTQSGTSVCSFTLAVWRPSKTKDEGETDFLDFVAWDKKAESLCKRAVKGDTVVIQATAQTRSYEAKDGSGRRKVVEFIAQTVDTFPKAPPAKFEPAPFPLSDDAFTPREDDGDLPF